MARLRTIGALLVAVGICLTALRLIEAPGGGARAARLFPDGFGETDSLVVERGDLRIELLSAGGRWSLVQPVAAGADAAEVMRFLDRLERAPLLDRLSLRDLRRRHLTLADFGLAPPAARVVIRGPLFRAELAVGSPTPSGAEVYAALDRAGDLVCVTDRRILDAFPASLETWRDRLLLREPYGQAAALEVRRPGAPFLKVVRDGDGWQLVQPVSGRASARAVGDALAALQSARIQRFILADGTNGIEVASGDARARLVFYGLDSETAIHAQVWESGNPVGAKIRFGREVEGAPGLVYALTPGDNSVVAVSNSVLLGLPKSVGEIRDRRLFDLPSAALIGLTIQYADETVTLERGETPGPGIWRMKAPVQGEADGQTAEHLAAAVLALRAERLVEPEAPAPDGAGAGEPLCRVEAVFAGGTTQRVAVAQSAYEAGCYDLTFCASPTVFVTAASNMPPQLTRRASVLELADRTLLAVPAPTIRRITVRGANRLETVERKGTNGDEQWLAGSGEADADGLKAWAALLGNWRARRVVRLGAGAQDAAAFGMADPWMEITVDVASEEAVRRSVLVGRVAEDGGRFVSVRGHDVIYDIPAEGVAVLERRLTRE